MTTRSAVAESARGFARRRSRRGALKRRQRPGATAHAGSSHGRARQHAVKTKVRAQKRKAAEARVGRAGAKRQRGDAGARPYRFCGARVARGSVWEDERTLSRSAPLRYIYGEMCGDGVRTPKVHALRK